MEFSDSTMTVAGIPMTYSRVAARALGLSERQLDGLMAGSGMSGRDLLRDDLYLNGRQQVQILSNALDIAGDESFGLFYGQQITPSTHGPMGFLVNSSPTLLEALEGFRDYLPLRMNLTAVSVRKKDDWLECRLGVSPGVTQKVYRLFIETLSLGLLAIAESILGRPLSEGRLWLSYEAPAYKDQYQTAYPCAVSFSASENLLRIPAALVNTVNASSDSRNYEQALDQCRQLLQQMTTDRHSVAGQVRRLLLSSPNHQLVEASVAAALFVSKRTLARRLEQEGTGFRIVRDQVLSSLAEGYLQNTQLSVDVIATLLNYHDSSNFRRAFKRWHGMSPDTFRKRVN
ncbi:MAG: AraC family transcriptional regulator ligand-binding domain-containing protein [Zhongshania sp.]|uniref:AraC family transcriptional regulator n=1 Tax=Zhongshania sp. TaxID=1971902 RepID=UPI00260FDB24|nr:AraC family transcriptional regulator [Zhongshania sp.]MDF1690770.1 AraC family transcriptional regulator ligand-binding domain-containing protein [Zhongshania sp.]